MKIQKQKVKSKKVYSAKSGLKKEKHTKSYGSICSTAFKSLFAFS